VPVVHGDCLAVMPTLEEASVDAIVCDPPYGLSFMGKDWDHGIPGGAFWREALRVAKPGAHLVAFGGTRTFHRLACAIEDAGWEIRDTLSWLYGSGFPKSLDVSKAMDKAAGAEREVLGLNPHARPIDGNGGGYSGPTGHDPFITAPATDLAKQWAGWGTALKPAWEPIILARKPLIGTVAANVAQFGTGALNIDACRVTGTPRTTHADGNRIGNRDGATSYAVGQEGAAYEGASGRWPANVVLSHSPECRQVGTRRVKGSNGVRGSDAGNAMYGGGKGLARKTTGQEVGYADADVLETVPAWECAPDCPVRLLDEQSGERPTGGPGGTFTRRTESAAIHAGGGMNAVGKALERTCYHDVTAGASRFYYTAKASRREREAGLEGMPRKVGTAYSNGAGLSSGVPDNPQQTAHKHDPVGNHHPTVKPLALMRWLCRLVTPPGGNGREPGLILDPFCGSGSTGCAAVLEGFRFLGIEQDESYCEIARRRIAHWAATVQPDLEPAA
jgi:hypothetical protein